MACFLLVSFHSFPASPFFFPFPSFFPFFFPISFLPPSCSPFLPDLGRRRRRGAGGISKTTFLFGDLQAGLTELRKVVILTVLKECTLKSAKDKDTESRVQEKPDPGFPLSSQWSRTDSRNSPSNSDRCAKWWQPGTLTEACCPGIVLGTSHLGLVCPCEDLSYSASKIRPSKGPADLAWPRAPGKQKQLFTVNHSVSNKLARSNVSVIETLLRWGIYSKASEFTSQSVGKAFLCRIWGLQTCWVNPLMHSHPSLDCRSGKCKLLGKIKMLSYITRKPEDLLGGC